jgi:hypothetical protein
VCVFERERERETDRQTDRRTYRQKEKIYILGKSERESMKERLRKKKED